MSEDFKQARYLRGDILRMLYIAYMGQTANPDEPMKIGKEVLVRAMEHNGTLPSSENLRAALHYLAGKGLVFVGWKTNGTGDYDWIELRPFGIDLVEDSKRDPGILFPARR